MSSRGFKNLPTILPSKALGDGDVIPLLGDDYQLSLPLQVDFTPKQNLSLGTDMQKTLSYIFDLSMKCRAKVSTKENLLSNSFWICFSIRFFYNLSLSTDSYAF